MGCVHRRGKLATEVTLASWFYTDNDEFFDGNYLEQSPLYTIQGHCDYTFRPGLWAAASVGFGKGARSTLNGILKDDKKENLAWLLSFGYPLSKSMGIKLAYLGINSMTRVGADSHSGIAALAYLW